MITAQQARTVGGFQAGLVPMQAGALQTTTTPTIDISSIMNLMMMMMVMVMMMKIMGQATASVK